jgi:hypothetical protein
MQEQPKSEDVYLLDVAHRKMKMMTANATSTLTTSPIDDSLVVMLSFRMRMCNGVGLLRWWLGDTVTLGAESQAPIFVSCDLRNSKLTVLVEFVPDMCDIEF